MSVRCECGWEIVVIQPEEHMLLLTHVFQHLKQAHGIDFPNIFCEWH